MKGFSVRLWQSAILLVLTLAVNLPAMACTTCNRPLQAAIFDASFTKLFLLMMLPFALVWGIVARLNKLK